MAFSRRTHAVSKAAMVGGLALVVTLVSAFVLGSFVAERLRSDRSQVRIPEPVSEPCEKQSWVNSDRACLTWTTPRVGVDGPRSAVSD